MRALRLVAKALGGIAVGVVSLIVFAVIVAFVALVVWAVWGHFSGLRAHAALARHGKRASRAYAHLEDGVTATYVRRLLGPRDDFYCCTDTGKPLGKVCWLYGGHATERPSTPVEVTLCFRHGRLVSKSRVWLANELRR